MLRRMETYEKNVRRLVRTIDEFFELKGANAAELQRQIDWLRSYHDALDRERKDKAERLQTRLWN